MSKPVYLTVAIASVALSTAAALSDAAPVDAAPPVARTAPACTPDPHYAKHDMRGMWIASVTNIDWPSKPGLSAAQQKAELIALFEVAQANNMNAVMLQVRPTADTFWRSKLEPWSHWLTGGQGQDPGYDPLGFAVEEAHARGLELHAWFNPFRIAMDESGSLLSPDHPARRHPEWTVSYGGKLYYNPGIPAAREHSMAVILEAVKNYDIDAVHFDDYFYPYPEKDKRFNDAAQYAAYGGGKSLGDWRRANIDALVGELGKRIKAIKPHVQFGISPFAVWRNAATDPTGSPTTAGAQTYDDLYADTRKWAQTGMVDYILPQIYWHRAHPAAPYDGIADWWVKETRGKRVNLYIGQATYRVGSNDKEWATPRELVSHLDYNQRHGSAIQGNVYFSAKSVADNKLDAQGLVARLWYQKPALTPRVPWIDGKAPEAPKRARWIGRTLSWQAVPDAARYMVYRVAKPQAAVTNCDIADTRNLVTIVSAPTTAMDFAGGREKGVTYLVSALDRGSNESAAAFVM